MLGQPGRRPPTTATVTQPGANTRVGNGAGGCLGNDGVNVETKHAYIWLDTGQWVPGSSITLGIQSIVFMTGPLGGFFDDDGAAIKINMKFDPVDVELYTAKAGEGNNSNADDTDMYVARVGINATKDIRVTLEGMLVNEQSLAGQSIGDTFWIGATVGAKLGTIQLDGAVVYGQRRLRALGGAGCRRPGSPFSESGFGAFVTAQIPVGPVNVFASGWYTTGDSTVGPAGCAGAGASQHAGCNAQGSARILTKDSDKLPVPESGASWSAAAARSSRSGSSVTPPSVARRSARSTITTRPARGARCLGHLRPDAGSLVRRRRGVRDGDGCGWPVRRLRSSRSTPGPRTASTRTWSSTCSAA